MKTKKSIFITLLCLALLICAMFLGGCSGQMLDSSDSSPLVSEPEEPADNIKGIMHATWPARTKEELVKEAMLIVHGTVTGRSESFRVENEYGVREMYTNYFVEVHEVLRGETAEHELTIRVMGGEIEGVIIETDFNPNFEIGGEYILLLRLPVGGPFDTPGYYYTISGHDPRAVFPRSTFGLATWDDDTLDGVLFMPHWGLYLDPFTLTELREMLVEINATVPVLTPETFRQQIANELWAAAHGGAEIGIMGHGNSSMTDEELERLEAEIYEILYAPPPRAWIVEE